jgi:ankyrin repeat protein
LAAQNDQPEIARILVEAGAETEVEADDASTPLDLAKSEGHAEIVSILEQHSAKRRRLQLDKSAVWTAVAEEVRS